MENKILAKALIIVAGLNLGVAASVLATEFPVESGVVGVPTPLATENPTPCQATATGSTPADPANPSSASTGTGTAHGAGG